MDNASVSLPRGYLSNSMKRPLWLSDLNGDAVLVWDRTETATWLSVVFETCPRVSSPPTPLTGPLFKTFRVQDLAQDAASAFVSTTSTPLRRPQLYLSVARVAVEQCKSAVAHKLQTLFIVHLPPNALPLPRLTHQRQQLQALQET